MTSGATPARAIDSSGRGWPFPVYLAGITVLRTVLWAAGVVGMGMILATLLQQSDPLL
jgi:hypothetical protein